MPTSCNIELYDGWQDEEGQVFRRKGVLLYHHTSGYPASMGPELERILKLSWAALKKADFPGKWDAVRVGALMVALSADEPAYGAVPRFQPCLSLHRNIEYLWQVFLEPGGLGQPGFLHGQYEIKCQEITNITEEGEWTLKPVNWRRQVEEELHPVAMNTPGHRNRAPAT